MSRSPVVFHVLEALEGGTARHVADITRHVDGVHHEVAIPRERVGGVTDRAAAAAMREAGAAVHLVEMRRLPVHPRNVVALAQLRGLLQARRPDVVHAHSAIGGVLGRAAGVGLPAARVYTAHGLNPGRLAMATERRLGRWTDRFVAVSESEAELAARQRLVPPGRLVVIRNGIDLDQPPALAVPDLRAVLGIGGDVPLVGCVARLVAQKAPEDFVRICARVGAADQAAHFVLIGSGPRVAGVKREAAVSRLGERFHHLAVLPAAGAALAQLDVFVLPSRFEGGPYTPLEAMRAGVPVVLSDCVGNRDLVESGRSGEVRRAGDVAGMAAAVLRLLGDDGYRDCLAAAARVRLVERFDVAEMGRRLGALYAELAG